jgi:hypothetical protein
MSLTTNNVSKLWIDAANQVVVEYNIAKGCELPMITSSPKQSTLGYEMYKVGLRVVGRFFHEHQQIGKLSCESYDLTGCHYIPVSNIMLFKRFFRSNFTFSTFRSILAHRSVNQGSDLDSNTTHKIVVVQAPYKRSIPLNDFFYQKYIPSYFELTDAEKLNFETRRDEEAHERTYGQFEKFYQDVHAKDWIPTNEAVRKAGGLNRFDYRTKFVKCCEGIIKDMIKQRTPDVFKRFDRNVIW